MADIPIILEQGQILLYGSITRRSSFYNIRAVTRDTRLNWGTVSQVYYGAELVTVGDNVCFNGRDLSTVYRYNGGRYYMIEETKLVTVENANSNGVS